MTRRRTIAALCLATPLAAAAGAPTLEPPGAVVQIAPAGRRADDTGSSQIGRAKRSVATPDGASARTAAPPPQLAAPGDAAPPAQLVRETRSGRGSTQLSAGPPNAAPPAPLSRPADGRTATVSKIGGRDRCDPAVARPGACRAVIETRGADFPPPDAEPLSPEQRLLVERRTIERNAAQGEAIAQRAARRVGRDGANPDEPSMQGLASVVLGITPASQAAAGNPAGDPTGGLTAEQATVATSLLGALDAPRR